MFLKFYLERALNSKLLHTCGSAYQIFTGKMVMIKDLECSLMSSPLEDALDFFSLADCSDRSSLAGSSSGSSGCSVSWVVSIAASLDFDLQ